MPFDPTGSESLLLDLLGTTIAFPFANSTSHELRPPPMIVERSGSSFAVTMAKVAVGSSSVCSRPF
jgi:hypothetical protein